MAVPDSLASWREFVDRQPVEPRRMTMRQISGLSPDEKADYDQERFAWLAADVVLETHDTVALTRQTRIIMARNMAKTATARRGLAMSGSSGLGKSTAALLIGKRHEKAMRKKAGRHDDTSYAPVVYAVVPPGTTPKMMMLAFANFLGLVNPNRATAQDLTERVVGVMRHLGTSLVVCDEIHNLRTNHQAGSEAASALKVFSERLDATFLYAGIDLLQSDLLSGQTCRRSGCSSSTTPLTRRCRDPSGRTLPIQPTRFRTRGPRNTQSRRHRPLRQDRRSNFRSRHMSVRSFLRRPRGAWRLE